ncbi:uncharacterized protein LOC108909730 [Anoplophora glabripennis]|uniref:uncharacterized protein LOC108909730 n=1 Tax=Anoplophora glabripennis TaxID=217634 RepID=UPI0008743537|nr:uncharacterized protein LOC108909730 [Anoplophora glabripennis]
MCHEMEILEFSFEDNTIPPVNHTATLKRTSTKMLSKKKLSTNIGYEVWRGKIQKGSVKDIIQDPKLRESGIISGQIAMDTQERENWSTKDLNQEDLNFNEIDENVLSSVLTMENKYDLAAVTETEIIKDIQSHLEEVKLTDNCYQRTSTPVLERRRCTIQHSRKGGYEKWCNRLEKAKPAFKVRGILFPPKDIVSGNLILFSNEGESYTDSNEKNPANERLDYHSDTMKKLLLSVVSDHCKSLLKRTRSLVKYNNKTKHSHYNLN